MLERRFPVTLLLALLAACDPPGSERPPDPDAPLAVPQDLYAEVNGVRLHYLDWEGSGDLMLFLPGPTQTAHTFLEVAPAFVDRFRVMALTHRGHGASHKSEADYDMATLVDDVLAFIQAVEADRVVLVAHSLSGLLLPDLARRLGSRVRALVFLDAVYDWSTIWDTPPTGSVHRYFSPSEEAYASREALDNWWRERFPALWGPTWRAMLRAQMYLGYDGRLHLQLAEQDLLRFIEISSAGTSYQDLRPPVLVVLSDDSEVEYGYPAAPSDSLRTWSREFHVPNKRRGIEQMRRELPGVTVLEIGAPHEAYVFAPGEVIEMIQSFLSRL